jgi:hypothetical protein
MVRNQEYLVTNIIDSRQGVTDKRVPGECRLAINKNGINCLNPKTNVCSNLI